MAGGEVMNHSIADQNLIISWAQITYIYAIIYIIYNV